MTDSRRPPGELGMIRCLGGPWERVQFPSPLFLTIKIALIWTSCLPRAIECGKLWSKASPMPSRVLMYKDWVWVGSFSAPRWRSVITPLFVAWSDAAFQERESSQGGPLRKNVGPCTLGGGMGAGKTGLRGKG